MLDSYEAGEYSGVTVDFGTSGFYYDAHYGRNWWSYYFDRISVGSTRTKKQILPWKVTASCAIKACFSLSRKRCNYLIKKHIRVKSRIKRRVRRFISKEMPDAEYIGVHYRGTDKMKAESSYISPEEACKKIADTLQQKKFSGKRIFVATDTEQFLQGMKNTFGERVVSYQAIRSSDGSPIHTRSNISGYQRGLEALIDCLILSKSQFLIRTSSNLSTVALFINPKLPSLCLNRSYFNSDR